MLGKLNRKCQKFEICIMQYYLHKIQIRCLIFKVGKYKYKQSRHLTSQIHHKDRIGVNKLELDTFFSHRKKHCIFLTFMHFCDLKNCINDDDDKLQETTKLTWRIESHIFNCGCSSILADEIYNPLLLCKYLSEM